MQFRQLALAADEGAFAEALCPGGNKKWRASRRERVQNVPAARTVLRIPSQQVHAEVAEILWCARIDFSGLNRPPRLLAQNDFEELAHERQTPRERLVQNHTDAVPIAGA